MFYNCADLQKVKLPANLTKLPGYTFYGCPLLETVELPETVTEIGDRAFASCNSLSSIDISNIKVIGREAFEDCGLLTSVDCSSANAIGGRAFANCSSLESVKLLKSGDLYIGGCAFYGCRNLQTITIPAGVTSLAGGEDLLYQETGAVSPGNKGWSFTGTDAEIVIEDNSSLTTLYAGAFSGVSLFTEITLPNVERIIGRPTQTSLSFRGLSFRDGGGIFTDCSNLKRVCFPKLKIVSCSAFGQCPSLECIEMPLLEEIDIDCIYENTFASSFKKIVLPETVKKVYWGTFNPFRNLNNQLTTTRRFDEVICWATVPPLSGTRYGYEIDCVLRVPAESVEAYKAADGWNKFKTILPIEE